MAIRGYDIAGRWTLEHRQFVHLDAAGKLANEDCDINNLAYHLAWYIYWNFSIHGQAVHVIAHSMGGLIIRSALFERPRQSVFPPTLLVENVTTVATPYLGAKLTPSSTQQGREMRGGSDYLNSLNTIGRPQGDGGTTWLTIGSTADTIVTDTSATNVCCSGMHKVVYKGLRERSAAPDHNDYFDGNWGTRTAPNRYACWGTNAYPNATQNADNVGPMVERGLSGVWQDWPAVSLVLLATGQALAAHVKREAWMTAARPLSPMVNRAGPCCSG